MVSAKASAMPSSSVQLHGLEPRLLLNADTLATAINCGALNGNLAFTDSVGPADRSDYYAFRVDTRRQVTVVLTGMTANADINLLGATGQTLAYSRLAANSSESVKATLDPGTYYVQVLSITALTNYRLGISCAYVTPPDSGGNSFLVASNLGALPLTQKNIYDYVGSGDGNDYYKFTLAAKSSFTATLSEMVADADMALWNSSGQPIVTSRNAGTANENIAIALNAGTYYLRVYPYAGSTSYHLTLAAPAYQAPDTVGDTMANARAVGALGATPYVNNELIGGIDANDYYSFTVATAQVFSLSLTGLTADANVSLLSNTGTILAASVNGGTSSESITKTISAGTYYVRIYAVGAATNYSLSMKATYPDAAGNTLAAAYDAGTLSATTKTLGPDYVGTGDTDDYYRFTLIGQSALTARITGLTGDADMSLLNGSGAVMVTSRNGGTTNETITRTLAAGTYFIRVYPYAGSTTYTLTLVAPLVDPVAPTAAFNAASVAFSPASATFTVTYSDNVAVKVASFDGSDIRITGPNSFSALASYVSASAATDGTPRTVTYRIAGPGGTWNVADAGVYSVVLNAGQVSDAAGNFVAAGALGSFTYAPEITPPTATFNRASVSFSSTYATFAVTYTDNSLVRYASLDGNDIRVTTSLGFSALAAFVSADTAADAATRTATYRVTAPGGTWDAPDLGNYTVSLVAGQVSDIWGNFAAASALGVFSYSPPPTPSNDWFSTHLSDAGLIASARAGYADASLSRTDMIALLQAATSDDAIVDAAELSDLRKVVEASDVTMPAYVRNLSYKTVNANAANTLYLGTALGNLAAGSGAAQLTKLINKWFLGLDHPTTTATYAMAQGTLFVNGVTYTDIRQGSLGDCYYVAALAEVAKVSPSTIQNMFIDNGDNTWTVRFYHNGRQEFVTVDRYLPVNASGKFIYASAGSSAASTTAELWVALAEKAYAQLNASGWINQSNTNSYAGLEGGWPADSISFITGLSTSSDFSLTTSDFTNIVTAINNNKMVNICTSDHAYAMIAYNASTQKFTIYNPWGSASDYTWANVLATFEDWSYTL